MAFFSLRRLSLCVWAIIALSTPARAHDLAIDQVMLWPDRQAAALQGQVTFDPELTRSKDAIPTDEHERQVVEFLKANLELELDRHVVPLRFDIRELWAVGGATPGDVVSFSAPLAASVREMRLHASGFKALVVSVQKVRPAPAPIETTSWLLGKDEWTPLYRLDTGWQAPGWRVGGPDVFLDAVAARKPPVDPSNLDPTRGTPASGDHSSLSARGPDSAPEASAGGLAVRFIRLGFEHILPGGLDHVLFVAALVLSRARRYRQVLISLSLFTLAHTLTLALGNFQLVRVSPRVVEPLIALSIFMLGVDNLLASRSAPAHARTRYLVVFGFGLIHGLGFASALSELAFDPNNIVLALFSFNLGVELGQIAVVVLLGLLLLSLQRWRELERYVTLAGSAVIAVIGLVMVVDRVSHARPSASTLTPAAASPPSTSPASPSRSPARSLHRSL